MSDIKQAIGYFILIILTGVLFYLAIQKMWFWVIILIIIMLIIYKFIK